MRYVTLLDWKEATQIRLEDPPFYALLTALVMKADTDNLAKLQLAFPEAVAEIKARYNAPAACLSLDEWEHEHGTANDTISTDCIEDQISKAKYKGGVTC